MEDQYTNELIKFGQQVRRLRKLKDMTQIDLELKCGISNGDISRIENGKKNLEFYTIIKLADALKVQLYELFLPDND